MRRVVLIVLALLLLSLLASRSVSAQPDDARMVCHAGP